jgi:hypothetical protein
MNLSLNISGTILLIIGFALVIKPNLFGNFSAPVDAYQMIEKRVKWGMFIGLGIFLLFHRDWTSWGLITAGFLTTLTLGVILARLTGFVLDGFITKQLWWLFIEFIALILFGYLYWKQNK